MCIILDGQQSSTEQIILLPMKGKTYKFYSLIHTHLFEMEKYVMGQKIDVVFLCGYIVLRFPESKRVFCITTTLRLLSFVVSTVLYSSNAWIGLYKFVMRTYSAISIDVYFIV